VINKLKKAMPEDKPQVKWYFKTSTLIIALLCVGPLALSALWLNPRFSRTFKIIISIIVLAITYYMTVVMVGSVKTIMKFYQEQYNQQIF